MLKRLPLFGQIGHWISQQNQFTVSRGGRYINEKLSKANKSVFLKLSISKNGTFEIIEKLSISKNASNFSR